MKVEIELSDKLIKAINGIKNPELEIELWITNTIKSLVVQQVIRNAQQAALSKKLTETKDW